MSFELPPNEAAIRDSTVETCGPHIDLMEQVLGFLEEGFGNGKELTRRDELHVLRLALLARHYADCRLALEVAVRGYLPQAMCLTRSALEHYAFAQYFRVHRNDSAKYLKPEETPWPKLNDVWPVVVEGNTGLIKGVYRNLSYYSHPRGPGLDVLVKYRTSGVDLSAGPALNPEMFHLFEFFWLATAQGGLAALHEIAKEMEFVSEQWFRETLALTKTIERRFQEISDTHLGGLVASAEPEEE